MPNFYTYIDWTIEETPRAFYVGKGNLLRIRKPDRNQKHKYVCENFGFRREIIFSSEIERECLELEILLIKEYHTFYQDELADKEIACNFTTGGDGTSGWVPTFEQKKNISDGIKRAHREHPEYADKISEKAKIRMNDPDFVKKISERIKQSFKNMPEHKKIEMHKKSSIANMGRISPQRGENCWRTTLNNEIVRQIKQDYAVLCDSYKKTNAIKILCEKYQQGYSAIYKIISGVTWRHVEA